MKKMISLIAAAALAMPAPILFAAPAQAAGNTGNVDICKAIVATNYYPTLSVGDCVSLFTSQDNYYKNGSPGYAAHYCNVIQEIAPDYFDASFDSYSDCVRWANSVLRS